MYFMSGNSETQQIRIHLETLHPSHMHVFFLVELYHLCNKVIIIELICSLFLKKYRLMEECSDKCHQKLFEKGFLFAHQKFLKVM